jgi:hypothetical protein
MTSLFPALRSTDGHRAPLVFLPREYHPRCAGCGHRQVHPVSGRKPVQTRQLAIRHPLTAAAELPRRRIARRK